MLLELCCLEEEEKVFDPPTLRVQAPLYRQRPGYRMSSSCLAIGFPMVVALAWVSLFSLSLCLGGGYFIKCIFLWTGISGVYAPGLPRILSWRGGLLGAVGGGRAWLASLRSPASAAPVGPLQPLIKRWLKVSSSLPAWAFGG
jgi:hypothetical protein